MNLPRNVSRIAGVLVLVGWGLFGSPLECGNRSRRLQTVVSVEDETVRVRYHNGDERNVLNDMSYDLSIGQQVKVVTNCDGVLHVAAAYAP